MRRILIATFSSIGIMGGLAWQLLDIIGRGDVLFKLPETLQHVQGFILEHQEIGYQIAPWFVMVIGTMFLVFLQWPHLFKFSRSSTHQTSTIVAPPDSSQTSNTPIYLTPYETVHYLADESQWGALKEAERTPEGLRKNVLLEAPLEFQKRAAEGKIRVYGINALSSTHELIEKTYWMTYGFYFETLFKSPYDECHTWPTISERPRNLLIYSHLKIEADDVYRTWPRHIEQWVPIHKAVAYIAERIGDTNESQCYPSTLTTLRQIASDGKVRMRGCKQLDIKSETRFSDIHTDIPKEYWVNSTIGAMATSPAYLKSTHTNPETAYSWGAKGVYDNNRYCDLMVNWNEILELWPTGIQKEIEGIRRH